MFKILYRATNRVKATFEPKYFCFRNSYQIFLKKKSVCPLKFLTLCEHKNECYQMLKIFVQTAKRIEQPTLGGKLLSQCALKG